ncbi:MAG: tetratricopeptide repeat protein [Chitinophagaceae bacterium]|nr:MAG: tetratricopeptide repeat protein [Chitinophagaceae bacterium]
MTRRISALLLSMLVVMSAFAQESPGKTAKAFIRQGDYNNAILVLNRALEASPDNQEYKKDLALSYYMQGDFNKSMAVIRPVVESNQADIQSYQILGMVYKAVNENRDAERMYRAAIRKFPESGALYNDFGELLWNKGDFGPASRQWLKGIQTDRNYPGNYYNAAKYYYMSDDKVWGLIYGEIFLNLESYSSRTPEIKSLLVEGYKKLFNQPDLMKGQDTKNDFVKAYLEISKSHSQVVDQGVTPDALTALRTRFVLSWYDKMASKFPYRLFDYHRQLAKAGIFDAYNQWIFGAAGNLSVFQQWTSTHPDEYARFTKFQKNRVFKMPEGQWYR